MIIQHNITALNAHRQLAGNTSLVSKNLEKLSSGYKINRAGDDAAGLAISEKMRAQITGLTRAEANAQDGISLVQTAEGALTEVHDMLNRMVDLSTQSANGTLTDEDRQKISDEIKALKEEIDRVSKSTNFNGINLLDGSLSGGSSSVNGTTLVGASIAKFSVASVTGAEIDEDMTAIDTTTNKVDTFSVDGQTLTIDWTKGDAATIVSLIDKDNAGTDATVAKDIADKLTNMFNDQMAEQGLSGSVKVTTDGTNYFFASNNTGKDSEFSFIGTDAVATIAGSVGNVLFGGTGNAVIQKADATYNRETIASGSDFNMTINGVKVNVKTAAEIKKTDKMDAVATTLQTAIQTAVDDYNTAMGLTAGAKDATSGLTGLTANDFTVEAKDGAIVVKYSGDVENVKFSFSDIGEKTTASTLGLVSSSTSAGNGGLTLQVGDTSDDFQKVTVSVGDMSTRGLGIDNIEVGEQGLTADSLIKVKAAINTVSNNRSALGALQNRLEHTINNLGVSNENMTAAESRIRDTDMAKEMMAFTKNNVLTQAAQAMLAQANQQPQSVLQLLQ